MFCGDLTILVRFHRQSLSCMQYCRSITASNLSVTTLRIKICIMKLCRSYIQVHVLITILQASSYIMNAYVDDYCQYWWQLRGWLHTGWLRHMYWWWLEQYYIKAWWQRTVIIFHLNAVESSSSLKAVQQSEFHELHKSLAVSWLVQQYSLSAYFGETCIKQRVSLVILFTNTGEKKFLCHLNAWTTRALWLKRCYIFYLLF